MIRILLAALLGLLAVSPASAQKTKAAIQTEITTLFSDNTTGLLTPAKLRTVTTDIVNSYVDWLTCTTGGGLVYWSAGTPTCLLAGTAGQVLKTNGASPPSWADVSSNILAGTNISITGTSPATVSVVGSPTFAGNVTAPTLNGNTFTTGTYTLTGTAAKTLTFNNSLTFAGTDGTTQTFQASDTIVGRTTTDTLTNKTLASPTVTGALTATGLVTYADMAAAALATSSQYAAGTANTIPPSSVIYPAETTTTFGATTTFDFSTFINTAVTLTGNITTMTLSNITAGKSGTIAFIQDGTGSRTTVWNSNFKFAGGTTPTLSTGINKVDVLSYSCRSATFCVASLLLDVR